MATEATRIGGRIAEVPVEAEAANSCGLLPDISCLTGPNFDANLLHPLVREFYEHTSRWRMDVWTQWSPAFAAPGAAIEALYGRRIQQLALPVNALAVAHGVDSQITTVLDSHGNHAGAAWLRTLRKSGDYMYSGYYRATTLPGHAQPSVHGTFPLEQGNVQVFLRPHNSAAGSLLLISPIGPFGDNGAYVTVMDKGRDHAARVPIHEEFHVYVDDENTLRTDHVLRLWRRTAVRLHYRLTPT
ncbi:hypothetical protein [Rhodococcus tibetensis]|uniref:Uncharacterized protein n=1 Tax=Rhodococcus tibetensis TaxID=2965064 RepID=A0ABT1QF64_9NOCA|nr:hypothetical protein [Rhodococcus sp. FXJ9.536]MCQ4120929.1 hypothetical protein [Rhodococcus sp. FXJ9.536]